jgi:hypothetical protein
VPPLGVDMLHLRLSTSRDSWSSAPSWDVLGPPISGAPTNPDPNPNVRHARLVLGLAQAGSVGGALRTGGTWAIPIGADCAAGAQAPAAARLAARTGLADASQPREAGCTPLGETCGSWLVPTPRQQQRAPPLPARPFAVRGSLRQAARPWVPSTQVTLALALTLTLTLILSPNPNPEPGP